MYNGWHCRSNTEGEPPLNADQVFEIGSKVFQRASTDPEFHALALRDGTAAVEQVVGRKLPDGMKIRFVKNNGATFTLGLPPVRSSDDLTDSELETVAGGRGGFYVGPVTGPVTIAPTGPYPDTGR